MSALDLLGSGWTQHARLLRLTTPAGPDSLLAEQAEIHEALGPTDGHAGFRIELTALSTDAHQSLTALLGQPARLDLQTAASRTELRPFHGHITQIVRLGANGGFTRYALTIEPWLAFLGQNRDSYLFQEKSVLEIVDEVLTGWQGQGKLVPAWRWSLADATLYPKRGLTTQYRESDLDFLKRLLAEEGLFCWFEHAADDGATLGSHTLVIGDHNGAFADNAQAIWRFTQSGATLAEDSLDRWAGQRRLDASENAAVSWDYRSLSPRPQSAASRIDNGAVPHLVAYDSPGPYAWETREQGERLLGNQREALDARLKHFRGAGTVRSAAPGSRFELAGHADHDGDDDRHFLITGVVHRARNNLAETVPGAADFSLLLDAPAPAPALAGQPVDGVAFYRNELDAIRADIPWRPLLADGQGRWLHPRPTVHGTQTAVVVGADDPTHTDRDLRIKVQFPWQRGSRSASRNGHPLGDDNAPADHGLGVWLRVMSPAAGANWGGHHTPRPGQEVVVAYLEGDVDRPVVIGTLYNGRGNADAAGNQLGAGAGGSTANAPAWYAGAAQGQNHNAALSGIKTQQLAASQSGQGGYNQLVFDDSPGQARIELATTEYQSALQLGRLKQQSGNARQADRGHGAELATQASAALRAGSGLLVSADARPGGNGSHLDSREAQAQTEQARALTDTLSDAAVKQQAGLSGDGQTLPAGQRLAHALEVLGATQSTGAPSTAGNGGIKATAGGTGTVPAWSEPRLQYSAPGGIAQVTPADAILAAGSHLSVTAGQDFDLAAQGHHALAVKDGLALFTVGKAAGGDKPNQETGIKLHAASGKVTVEAQGGKLTANADQDVTVASTTGSLTAQAKGHVLATAGGAYLRIEGGNIELHAPGSVSLHASMKNLTGPASVDGGGTVLPQAKDLYDEQFRVTDKHTGAPMAYYKYRIVNDQGEILARGITDQEGNAMRIHSATAQGIHLLADED